MDIHPQNTDIKLAVPAVEDNGSQILNLLDVKVTVRDEKQELIGTFSAPLPEGAAVDYSVTIPKAMNVLSEGVRGLRYVTVEFLIGPHTNAIERTVVHSIRYMIGEPVSLVVMDNSFALFGRFLLDAPSLLNAAGWSNATEQRQIAALIQAYRNITRMSLEYTPLDKDGQYEIGQEEILEHLDWHQMRAAEFEELPSDFREALIRAQLLEANELLQGNVYDDRVRSGVRSETIGESSVTFNTSVRQFSVSRSALQVLGPYIVRSVRLARA
ncbi:hypothetical protein FHV99_004675 [Ochrobactrum sp. P20RRXII]|nr:hypothetical protein [Ochrobactrum sp. P20RRXII]NIH77423.1 hypothetical protein [Ochrobactrum sp. P20RRXII]